MIFVWIRKTEKRISVIRVEKGLFFVFEKKRLFLFCMFKKIIKSRNHQKKKVYEGNRDVFLHKNKSIGLFFLSKFLFMTKKMSFCS